MALFAVKQKTNNIFFTTKFTEKWHEVHRAGCLKAISISVFLCVKLNALCGGKFGALELVRYNESKKSKYKGMLASIHFFDMLCSIP